MPPKKNEQSVKKVNTVDKPTPKRKYTTSKKSKTKEHIDVNDVKNEILQNAVVQEENHRDDTTQIPKPTKKKESGFMMESVYNMTTEEKESIFNEYDKFKKKVELFKHNLENSEDIDDINNINLFENQQDDTPSKFSTIEFDETKKSSIIPRLMKKNIKELEILEDSFMDNMNNNLKLLRLFNFVKFLKNTLGDTELYKMYEKSGNNFDFFNNIKMPVKKIAFIFEDDKDFKYHTEFDNYRYMGDDIVSIHFKMMLNKKIIKMNERNKILECIDDFEKNYDKYEDDIKDKKFRSFVNKIYKYNTIDSNMEESVINQIIFRNTLESGKMEILERLKTIDTDNFDKDQFKKDLQELQKINELQKYGEKMFDDTTDIFDDVPEDSAKG